MRAAPEVAWPEGKLFWVLGESPEPGSVLLPQAAVSLLLAVELIPVGPEAAQAAVLVEE